MSSEERFIAALEAVIDARYKYLKELDYENHSYASNIKKKYYDPAVEIFLEILKKEFDFSEK